MNFKTILIIFFLLANATITSGLDGIAITVKSSNAGDDQFGPIWRHDIKNSTVENRTPLFSGNARCPVFNWNGDSIAFQRKEGGRIYLSVMPTVGGTPEDIIEVDVDMFYMDWPQGDYLFYNMGWAWPTDPAGKIINKVDITTGDIEQSIEFTAKTNGELRSLFHWQMSSDGQRMGITGFPTQMCVFDFSWNTTELDKCLEGCSFGISPDGQYKTNNMEEAGVISHRTYRILTFDGVEQVRFNTDESLGVGNYFNWHHFGVNSNDWVIVPQGWGYSLDGGMNMTLHNWRTDEKVLVTENRQNQDEYDWPSDFWEGDPGSKTGNLQQLDPPSINPASGEFSDPFDVTINHGRSSAQLYYTFDGSDPDDSSLPYSDPFEITLPDQGTITVKAIAYEQGWDPSEVAYTEYTRPDTMPPDQVIRVLYPNSQDLSFQIGDTMHIRWEVDTSQIWNVMVFAAVDIQKTWVPLALGSIEYGTDEWNNFLWEIPDSLDGVPTVTDNAFIRVTEYNTHSIGDDCDYAFRITDSNSGIRLRKDYQIKNSRHSGRIWTIINKAVKSVDYNGIYLINSQGKIIHDFSKHRIHKEMLLSLDLSPGLFFILISGKQDQIFRLPLVNSR